MPESGALFFGEKGSIESAEFGLRKPLKPLAGAIRDQAAATKVLE